MIFQKHNLVLCSFTPYLHFLTTGQFLRKITGNKKKTGRDKKTDRKASKRVEKQTYFFSSDIYM